MRRGVRHDHHIAALGRLVNRLLDQRPQGLRIGSRTEVDRTDGPEGHHPGGASGDGEIPHEPVDDLRPMLDVGEFRDRHATRFGGVLQDLLVDQPVTQLVGDRLADRFAARTDEPCNADHPSRHRRTVGAVAPPVKQGLDLARIRSLAGMYVPGFSAVDEDGARDIVSTARSGWLVTGTGDGPPTATLMPIMWRGDRLVAHMAKANPHWRAISDGMPALVIVTGPEAYISPSWYASKAEHGRVVPTWNYLAVHLTGTVSVHRDPAWFAPR